MFLSRLILPIRSMLQACKVELSLNQIDSTSSSKADNLVYAFRPMILLWPDMMIRKGTTQFDETIGKYMF